MASSEGNYHRRGPYFDGTNFASWKHKMKMHILGHNPAVGVKTGGSRVGDPVTPRIQLSIFVTPTLAFSGDAI